MGGGETCFLVHDRPEYCCGKPFKGGGCTFGPVVLLQFIYLKKKKAKVKKKT